MNDVMLPWPEPRRPKKDRPEQAQAAPHYEIQRVNSDGSTGPVEVLPITRPPWSASSGRRGFLGAGIASSVAAALLLGGCDDDDPKPPSPSPGGTGSYPTPTESTPYPTPSDSPTYPTDVPSYPSDTPSYSTDVPAYPTDPPSPVDPTYGTTGGSSSVGGTGGTICTCNKVCTCIPVCQAHELLNPDPVIRRMSETVLVAMGTRELAYLRWAARRAAAPLRSRIEELIEELRAGRRLGPGDLADPGCAPYLTSRNPVVALTAAQHLTLRALLRGERLSGTTADRAAKALTAGHALHVERAPAWKE